MVPRCAQCIKQADTHRKACAKSDHEVLGILGTLPIAALYGAKPFGVDLTCAMNRQSFPCALDPRAHMLKGNGEHECPFSLDGFRSHDRAERANVCYANYTTSEVVFVHGFAQAERCFSVSVERSAAVGASQ